MSFSADVKKELSQVFPKARHCLIAELAGIVTLCGRVRVTETGSYRILIHTENIFLAKKLSGLLICLFKVAGEISIRRNMDNGNLMCTVAVKGKTAKTLLEVTKLLTADGDIKEELSLISNLIVQNSCCKKAFIRGAFMAAGSIGDPNKAYHFEIVAGSEDKAWQLSEILNSLGLNTRVVKRKKYYPVYLKEGDRLVDLLGFMGANLSLMEFENIRILRGVRNNVNRGVNCETANLKKTADAAAKQLDDIEYLKNRNELEKLSDGLRELAELRIANTEMTLKELGMLLDPPLGKSGVNHRLNKISRIAEEMRERKD